jgi:hypothetical protein
MNVRERRSGRFEGDDSSRTKVRQDDLVLIARRECIRRRPRLSARSASDFEQPDFVVRLSNCRFESAAIAQAGSAAGLRNNEH